MTLNELQALRKKGNNLYQEKRFEESKTVYAEALKKAEHLEGVSSLEFCLLWSNISQAHIECEEWTECVDASTKALYYEPAHTKSLLRRSVALQKLNRLSDAMADLKRCLRIEPCNVEATRLFYDCHEREQKERNDTQADHLLSTNLNICVRSPLLDGDGESCSDPKNFRPFMQALGKVFQWSVSNPSSKATIHDTPLLGKLSKVLNEFPSAEGGSNTNIIRQPLPKNICIKVGHGVESGQTSTLRRLWIQVATLKLFNQWVCELPEPSDSNSSEMPLDASQNPGTTQGHRKLSAVLYPPMPSAKLKQTRDVIRAHIDAEAIYQTLKYCSKSCENPSPLTLDAFSFSDETQIPASAICEAYCREALALFESLFDLENETLLKAFTLALELAENRVLIMQSLCGLGRMGAYRVSLKQSVQALRKTQALKHCILSLVGCLRPETDATVQKCAIFTLTQLLRLLADKERPANQSVNILDDLQPLIDSSLMMHSTGAMLSEVYTGLRLLECIYNADRAIFCTAMSSKNALAVLYKCVLESGSEDCTHTQSLGLNLFTKAMEFPELRDIVLEDFLSDDAAPKLRVLENLVNFCVVRKTATTHGLAAGFKAALAITKIATHHQGICEYILTEMAFLDVGIAYLENPSISDHLMNAPSPDKTVHSSQDFFKDDQPARQLPERFLNSYKLPIDPEDSLIQHYLELFLFLSFHGHFKSELLRRQKKKAKTCKSSTSQKTILGTLEDIGEGIADKRVNGQFALLYCGILSNLLKSRLDKERVSRDQQKSAIEELDNEQLEALREFWNKLPDASKPRQSAVYDRGDPEVADAFLSLILESNLFGHLMKICQVMEITPESLGQSVDVIASVIKKPAHRSQCLQAGGLRALMRAADFYTCAAKQKSLAIICFSALQNDDLTRCRQCLAQLCITINPQLFTYKEVMDLTSNFLKLLSSSHELHQYEAALALTNLMAVSDSSRQCVLHGQGVPALMDLVTSDNALLRAAGLEGVCNLSMCEDFLDQLAQGQHKTQIQLILAFLGETDNMRAQIAASGCLALITTNAEVVAQLLMISNVANLLKVVHQKEDFLCKPDLQLRILTVFQNILTLWPSDSSESTSMITYEEILNCLSSISEQQLTNTPVLEIYTALKGAFVESRTKATIV